MQIDNVGSCVGDLRRSVSFYGNLGFQMLSENDRCVTVASGEAKLFLFETRVAGQAPARELGLFENPPGIDHVSFLVEDVDALHDELVARDQDRRIAERSGLGARAFGLRDPDGLCICVAHAGVDCRGDLRDLSHGKQTAWRATRRACRRA
jgi:catechol 2,3-dioxygenase-like lactoylglutathione lyase family enzyme